MTLTTKDTSGHQSKHQRKNKLFITGALQEDYCKADRHASHTTENCCCPD